MKSFAVVLFILILSLSSEAQQTNSVNERNEVVGSYSLAKVFGALEIILRDDDTYSWRSTNCTSALTETGLYSVANGVVRFTPKKQIFQSNDDRKERDVTSRKARKKYLDIDEPWVPETASLQILKWGARTYLLAENEFGEFVDAINLG